MSDQAHFQYNAASLKRYAVLRYSFFAYLSATLALYFFGPVPWIIVSPFSIAIILLSYTALAYGSRFTRKADISRFTFSLRKVHFARRSVFLAPLFTLFGVWLILFIRNYIYFASPIPLPSVILTSYDLLKSIENEVRVFAYINFLLAPLLLWLLSAVSVWRPRRALNRCLRVLTLGFYFYSSLILGSGNALVEVVILFGLVYFRRTQIRRRVFFWVVLFAILFSFALSLMLLNRLDGVEKLTVPIVPSQAIFFEQPVSSAGLSDFTAFIITFYLTNGYQGFQFAADKEADAIFLPFASSYFMQRQYERYGLLPDGFERLESKIAQSDAWPPALLWTTSFLWLRENIPMFLLPVFCFFLGKLYFQIIMGFLIYASPFRLAQSMLMSKIILFLPLNAISLSTGDEFMRTLVYIILPGGLILTSALRR